MSKRWFRSRTVQGAALTAVATVAAALILRNGGALPTPTREPEPQAASTERSDVDEPTSGRNWLAFSSADDLMEYIETLPPLMRNATIDSVYVGSWVRWQGVIDHIRAEADYLRVGLIPADTAQRMFVILRFEPSQRAVVDPLREGDWLTYEGHLVGVSRVPIAEVVQGFWVDSVSLREPPP